MQNQAKILSNLEKKLLGSRKILTEDMFYVIKKIITILIGVNVFNEKIT